jgi:hypothetical protein
VPAIRVRIPAAARPQAQEETDPLDDGIPEL